MTAAAPCTSSEPATQLWWWEIPDAPAPGDLDLLTSPERQRLMKCSTPRRAAEFVTSRAAARRILAARLGEPPESVVIGQAPCPDCAERHGPPKILQPRTPLHISISHTRGLGCLGVSTGDGVGVDVEYLRPVDPAVPGTTFSQKELDYLRALPPGTDRQTAVQKCWTRKEALLKAVGIGVSRDLKGIETNPQSDTAVVTGPGTAVRGPRPWLLCSLPLGSAHLAAVARRPDSGPLTIHRFAPPTGDLPLVAWGCG
ncbi:4'-phosphopantetheinyl transferase family protein [Streptomyces mirabilis]|uniref:4'-phosphopantetheinyl transferase family protein n=1 Tax=Streptomyces mirabilis TaxID=68239 RepID=UPI00367CCA1E